MTTTTCPWTIFNDREKDEVDFLLDLTGKITCIVSFWFILAYFFTSLKEDPSYKNIAVCLATAWIRRAITIIVNVFIDKKSELWKDTPIFEIFAAVETFMAVHEMECFTHVCIERYIVTKYHSDEWTMPRKYYVWFRLLCLLFASVYSLAPALGLGGYGFDFTCSSYTMDMILPKEKWRKCVAFIIFILRSVKPVGLMICMIWGCKNFAHRFTSAAYSRLQWHITLDVMAMTLVLLMCSVPIFTVRGTMVMMQPKYGTEMNLLSKSYVKLALLLHWNSLLPIVITLFLHSRNIREATLKLRFRDILGKSTTNKDKKEK